MDVFQPRSPADQKSCLQSGIVLFSDGWWSIGMGVISRHILENYQHIFIYLLEFLVGLIDEAKNFHAFQNVSSLTGLVFYTTH